MIDQSKIYRKNQKRTEILKNLLKNEPEILTPEYDSDIDIEEDKLELNEKYDIM